ncbi:hypothetical protein DB48_14565 [Shewanella sp. cp20]|nr:hypothetical protein DB48_14565 [Shewanella sp. cp20]
MRISAAELLSNATDIDTNDIGLLSVDNLNVDHGSITTNPDGSFTFIPEKDYNGAVHFSYDVKDAHGGITHTGASTILAAVQDNAVITGIDTGNVTEDLNPHASVQGNYAYKLEAQGSLSAIDPDKGESGFDFKTLISVATHPEFRPYISALGGELAIDQQGNWNYYIDNRKPEIQQLGEGDTLKDTVTIHSKDGTPHVISITIHGTNDAPVVKGEVTLTQGTEDTAVTLDSTTLLAHTTDIDTGDTALLSVHNLVAVKPDGTSAGIITNNHNGTFTFTPETNYNGTVRFNFEVQDPHGAATAASASMTLAAINDAATLSNIGLSITEDRTDAYAMLHSGWQNLDVQDPDEASQEKVVQVEINGVIHDLPANFADNIAGLYGTFNFTHGTDGHDKWSYSADNNNADIQGLKDGQSLHDRIVFITADGTRIPTQVDIHGHEDGVIIDTPAATTSALGAVVEDTHVKVEGQLLAHDADKDDAISWQPQTIKDAHGTFNLDANGHWSYTLDPVRSQILKATDSFAKGFDVTAVSSDGSKSTRHVEVLVQGSDDQTQFSGVNTGQTHEDGNDVFQVGTQYLHDATNWQKFEVTDPDTQIDHLTIESGGQTYQWDMHSNLDIHTPYGMFQLIHSDGTSFLPSGLFWNYIGDNQNPAVQGLKAGETLPPEMMTLVAPDGTRFPINVKVNGTEDGVKIDTKQEHLGDIDEQGATAASVSGQLHAHDLDTHDTVSWHTTPAGGLQGSYGTLEIHADGSWIYAVDPAKAAVLAPGQQKAEYFNVTAESTDGSTQTIKIGIDVHGTNQNPTVSGAVHLPNGTEDRAVILTPALLTANTQDVDWNFMQAFHVQNLTADHGQIAQNTDGTFTFTPDTDYNGPVTFHYEVVDHNGGRVSTSANMTLGAVNDAAIIGGIDTGHVTEDVNTYSPVSFLANMIHCSGQLTITDADTGEDHFNFSTLVHDVFHPEWAPYSSQLGGRLTIDRQGVWEYVIDTTKPEIQALGKGDTLKDHVIIHSADGTSHTIELTIHGTNDAPVVSSEVTLAPGIEDTPMRISATELLSNATDIDTNDVGQLSVDNLNVDHGSITTNPDGSFTFIPEKDYNGAVHFSYDVKDAHGGVTHTGASTTLAAVKDQARVSGDTRGNLSEDHNLDANNKIAITGHLNVLDPDAGQQAFHSGTASQVDDPFGGSLHIGADGNWTYKVDNAKLQHLSEHQEVLVTHRVYTLDGTPQDIVIKITGTNDIPKLGLMQISSTTGHLSVQDSDNQDTHTFSVIQQSGLFGSLVVDPDTGAYSYQLNQSVSGMHYDKVSGQYLGVDTFEVQVSDNHGGSETKYISFDARVSLTMPTGTSLQPQLHATVTSASQLVDTKPQTTSAQTPGNAITLALSHSSDTGHSDSDGITNNTQPIVEGQTSIPFSLVTLYEQGHKLTSILSDANGHYSAPLSSLSEGAHQITATAQAPGTHNAVQATPLSLKVDTQASIDMNPVAGDNMLQAVEQHQPLIISGTVSNVEEGQQVTVILGGQQYHTSVHNGCWSTQLSGADVDALPGGNLEIKAMVSDLAGNQAQMSSPLYVVDHANPIPTMSFLKPPTPTGTGSVGSHITGDLIAPPLLQQLTPNAQTKGAWAIDDGHGHPTLSLRGQYGTLTIDPDTGHVDYVYNQAPSPGQKATGGTHWAGETISETHHDIFHILYHDSHSSNVDVKVNLDITYIHGHSGQNQQATHLVDMTVTPATTNPAPPPPELHDSPEENGNQETVYETQVFVDQVDEDKAEDSTERQVTRHEEKPTHVLPHEVAASDAESSHTEAEAQPLADATLSPVDHYLQMIGLSQQDLTLAEHQAKPEVNLDQPLNRAEHFDADDLTLTTTDHFDNPLLEEHEKEKPHPSLVDIEDPRDELHANSHDDDLLHNALNDMHNQF